MSGQNYPNFQFGNLNADLGPSPTTGNTSMMPFGSSGAGQLQPVEDLTAGDFRKVKQQMQTVQYMKHLFAPETLMEIVHYAAEAQDSWEFQFATRRRRTNPRIQFTTITITKTPFSRAPTKHTPRMISHEEQTEQGTLIRFDQGFELDPEFQSIEAGGRLYRIRTTQILNNWILTQKILVRECIEKGKDYWYNDMMTHGEQVRSLAEAVAEETATFGGVAKDERFLHRLIRRTQRRANTEQVNFTKAVIPYGAGVILDDTRLRTEYNLNGPGASSNLRNIGKDFATQSAEVDIHEDDVKNMVDTRHNQIDFLKTITRIGEWYGNFAQRYDACIDRPCYATKLYGEPRIYNAAVDDMSSVTLRDQIRYSGIYNEDGELSDFTQRLCDDLNDDYEGTLARAGLTFGPGDVHDPYIYETIGDKGRRVFHPCKYWGQQPRAVSGIDALINHAKVAKKSVFQGQETNLWPAIEAMLLQMDNLAEATLDPTFVDSEKNKRFAFWTRVVEMESTLKANSVSEYSGVNEFGFRAPSLPRVVKIDGGEEREDSYAYKSFNGSYFTGDMSALNYEEDLPGEFAGETEEEETESEEGTESEESEDEGNGNKGKKKTVGDLLKDVEKVGADGDKEPEEEETNRDAEAFRPSRAARKRPGVAVLAQGVYIWLGADSPDDKTPVPLETPEGFSTWWCQRTFAKIHEKNLVGAYWQGEYQDYLAKICRVAADGVAAATLLLSKQLDTCLKGNLLVDGTISPEFMVDHGVSVTEREKQIACAFTELYDKVRAPLLVKHQSKDLKDGPQETWENLSERVAKLLLKLSGEVGNKLPKSMRDAVDHYNTRSLPLAHKGYNSLLPSKYNNNNKGEVDEASATVAQAVRVGYGCIRGGLLVLLSQAGENARGLWKKLAAGAEKFRRSRARDEINRGLPESAHVMTAVDFIGRLAQHVDGNVDGKSLNNMQTMTVKMERVALLVSNFVTLLTTNSYQKSGYKQMSFEQLRGNIFPKDSALPANSSLERKGYHLLSNQAGKDGASVGRHISEAGEWVVTGLSINNTYFHAVADILEHSSGNALKNRLKMALLMPFRAEHPGAAGQPITHARVEDVLAADVRYDEDGYAVDADEHSLWALGADDQVTSVGSHEEIRDSLVTNFRQARVVHAPRGTLHSSNFVRYAGPAPSAAGHLGRHPNAAGSSIREHYRTAPVTNYDGVLAGMFTHSDRAGGPNDPTGGRGYAGPMNDYAEHITDIPDNMTNTARSNVLAEPVGQFVDEFNSWRYHEELADGAMWRITEIHRVIKDPIERAFALLYVFAPVHENQKLAWIDGNMRMPTNYILVRPEITIRTGAMLFFQANGTTAELSFAFEHGNTAYNGPRDTAVAHVIGHSGATLINAKGMQIVPHVFLHGYKSGMDCTFFTHGSGEYDVDGHTQPKSIFVLDVGANMNRGDMNVAFDLSGKFNLESGFSVPLDNAMNMTNEKVHYPSALRYSLQNGFHTLHNASFNVNRQSWKKYNDSKRRTTMMFPGTVEYFDPLTSTWGTEAYRENGSGHLPSCGRGMLAIMNGDKRYVDAAFQ